MACKNAKPKADGKPVKLFDGHGLYLYVTEKSKIWRQKFYLGGKERLVTIGHYPKVTLADARDEASFMKKQIEKGIDPVQYKKQSKQEQIEKDKAAKAKAHTFEDAFNEWYKIKEHSWTLKHAQAMRMQFNSYLYPIANSPISEITPMDCVKLLKSIESQNKLSTLDKTKRQLSQVMRYAVSTGKLDSDPSRDISNDIFVKRKKFNYAHQTDQATIQAIYQTISLPYKGYSGVHNALKLVALTFLRAKELAGLKWSEVDFDKKLLKIEASRMKMKREHLVPLSSQALSTLADQQQISFESAYVFASPKNIKGHISTQSLLVGLRKQGIKKEDFTTHGWRHAASTTLHEKDFTSEWIEVQLAHLTPSTKGVYNKAKYLEQRTAMMQWWSDFLHCV
jgi:integrase